MRVQVPKHLHLQHPKLTVLFPPALVESPLGCSPCAFIQFRPVASVGRPMNISSLGRKQEYKFERIEFVPAAASNGVSALTGKGLVGKSRKVRKSGKVASKGKAGEEPPESAFPESEVYLQWRSIRPVGAGLHNLGNTCFMNSVLQALCHTPPFAELALKSAPFPGAQRQNLVSTIQGHFQRALRQRGADDHFGNSLRPASAFSPSMLVKTLSKLNRRFKNGRQEDAHEYLLCLLDHLHEAHRRVLKGSSINTSGVHSGKGSSQAENQANSFVHSIFGGRMRSQIECMGVDYESSLFEPFLDMSLQIFRCRTLNQALDKHHGSEMLEGNNKYRCPLNNKLVPARRSLFIQEPPNVLIIHLKRFEFAVFGKKVARFIQFQPTLNLSKYMHPTAPKGNHEYDLVSVVVHHGSSTSSGHYISYVKSASGQWYVADDSRVASVRMEQVLKQQAYILLYIRREPRHWRLQGGKGPVAHIPDLKGKKAGKKRKICSEDDVDISSDVQPRKLPVSAEGQVSVKGGSAAAVEPSTAQALNPKANNVREHVSDTQNAAAKQDGEHATNLRTNVSAEESKERSRQARRVISSPAEGANCGTEGHPGYSTAATPSIRATELGEGEHAPNTSSRGAPVQASASQNARSPMRMRFKTTLCASGCVLSGRSTKSLDIMRKHLRYMGPVRPRVLSGSGCMLSPGGAQPSGRTARKSKDTPVSPLQQTAAKGGEHRGNELAQRPPSKRIAARSNTIVNDNAKPKAVLRSSPCGADTQEVTTGAKSQSNRSALTHEAQSIKNMKTTARVPADADTQEGPIGHGAPDPAQTGAAAELHVQSAVSEGTALRHGEVMDKSTREVDNRAPGPRRHSRPLDKILGVGVPKGEFGLGTWDDSDGGGENAGSRVENGMSVHKKRNIPDEHDEEYDRGKVKKVRKNKHERILGPGKEKILQVQQSGNAGVRKSVPFKSRSRQGPAKGGRGGWGMSRGRGRGRGGRSMPSRRGSRGR